MAFKPLAPWLLLAACPALFAQPAGDAKPSMYRRVLASTVWIVARTPQGSATGTGWVVDAERRLVVTNFHVVGQEATVAVVFPEYRDGAVIPEKAYYTERNKARKGTVLRRSPTVDLAVVEVDQLPSGVVALPLASESIQPGESVQSVGNPGVSGALWVYTSGTVRQVYRKEFGTTGGQKISARVVETQSPINPGDSGGPVVNSAGQLIGVVTAMREKANLLSFCIDVTEVKTFLGDMAPKAPVRAAPVFNDAARFFSDAAKAEFLQANAGWLAKHKFEVVVLTFPVPPDGDEQRVRDMAPADRGKYFFEWAVRLARAHRAQGVLLLACKSPGRAQFAYSAVAKKILTEEDRKEIEAAAVKAFGASRPDDALKFLRELLDRRLAANG